MGIPKFYIYISERYPCLNERLKSYQIPEFDNLYLDMNGIIHTCSHPEDSDVHFRNSKTHFTKEEIFQNVCHYVEILFRIIQPQRLLYIAFDGVSPKAKINQQRGRRFKVAETMDSSKCNSEEETNDNAVLDTNCITPGTAFMKELNDYMEHFFKFKISEDELWRRCKIIYSRCEVPGEGEHKIMEYIRYMKTQPDYCPDTRHCLYGLDADLITLGMCSHEPHFSLLREEITFGKKQRLMLTPEETTFCLLHLSLLRNYLEHEFASLKNTIKFPFDIEKIIDDWILMTLLIGNDFIPNLPGLYILNGALETVYKVYIEVLPTLNGYINDAGTLWLDRFQIFLKRLSQIEMDPSFKQTMEMAYDDNGIEHKFKKLDVSTETDITSRQSATSENESCVIVENEQCKIDLTECKQRYYKEKLHLKDTDESALRKLSKEYINAIQWNLYYYYHGCCSWSWYYPYHYAPFMSDIKNIRKFKLKYEMGVPLLPVQHLLSLLPPRSKNFLPKAYQWLVTSEESPIIQYYPKVFKTDQNGKMHDWEAIALIPIIEEAELMNAIKQCPERLTVEEEKRNKFRKPQIYIYSEKSLGTHVPPDFFSPFDNHAKVIEIDRERMHVPKNKLIKGLCPGIHLDVYYPGFYTLQYIEHIATFETMQTTIYKKPSIAHSIIIHITEKKNVNLSNLAKKLLGKNVFVNWPHLIEAYVVGVSDNETKLSLNNYWSPYSADNLKETKITTSMNETREEKIKCITNWYKDTKGIVVGNIRFLIHACPMIGKQYKLNSQNKLESKIQWNKTIEVYPYQTIVTNIKVSKPTFVLHKTVEDIFKIGSVCFMMRCPNYGTRGTVVEPAFNQKTGRVSISMTIAEEPNFEEIVQNSEEKLKYVHGSIAATKLGITSHFLSRITGGIYVVNDEDNNDENYINIGLNLKFNKKNEEVPEYTKKKYGCWFYSNKTIELVKGYMENNPELCDNLSKKLEKNTFQIDELFPTGPEKLQSTLRWLSQQSISDLESCPCGSTTLTRPLLQKVEKIVIAYTKSQTTDEKTVVINPKAKDLFVPALSSRDLPPALKAEHRLLDRVVCVRNNFTVPMGYKGTIVGIHKAENPLDNTYSVLFDKEFVGAQILNNCETNRGYRLSIVHFLNISYGTRSEQNAVKGQNEIRGQSPSKKSDLSQNNDQQNSNIESTMADSQNNRKHGKQRTVKRLQQSTDNHHHFKSDNQKKSSMDNSANKSASMIDPNKNRSVKLDSDKKGSKTNNKITRKIKQINSLKSQENMSKGELK